LSLFNLAGYFVFWFERARNANFWRDSAFRNSVVHGIFFILEHKSEVFANKEYKLFGIVPIDCRWKHVDLA
jgi:hypothetical protein